ncbi:MAG: branched-chain amino acid ABC transporter permease [Candidatus Rokuibacteriota bacterium]|nr:MAG: branched-chain amino acid ABC transporter permease [Candidatus Rokubacteria bacterium]
MRAGRGTALPLAGLAVGVAALPLLGSVFADTVMALAGLFAIVAVGLNLLFGYAGKISFGHNAFMAMGAYASGILTTGAGLPPLGALVAGAAGTGAVAFLLGAPILRLRGHYLAMATLALGEITIIVSTRWTEVTGGLTGIPGVPDFRVLGVAFDTKTKLYYLIWAVALGGLCLSFRVIDSRFGRALRALGAHEAAAEALGVPVVRYRVQVFVLSAVYAAVAGGLYAHFLNYVNGTFFDLPVMVELMAMLVVGGIGTRWGPIVGAVPLMWVSQSLGRYADYSLLIFGALYGVALLFLPRGLCGELVAWAAGRRGGS